MTALSKLDADFNELIRLLDPFCWGTPDASMVICGSACQFKLRLMLRPAVQPTNDEEARDALWSAAQHAIRTVEAAGWKHMTYPETNITGDVHHHVDGTSRTQSARAVLSLHLAQREQR